MKAITFILISLFFTIHIQAQVVETKNWCTSKCDMVGDELENTNSIFETLLKDSSQINRHQGAVLEFPLRIGLIQSGDSLSLDANLHLINQAVDGLNKSFKDVGFSFFVAQTDIIKSPLRIEELSENGYEPYDQFSDTYDIKDMISIYVFDYANDFCTITESSISCGRTGGFSYILSNRTNNIVLSQFDLKDPKVVAHEMGHFFGLYHTFEEQQFGKDTFGLDDCQLVGDRICDTPPDPGPIFEIYINYSTCEMYGLDSGHNQEYKPLINNIMSYYKPCYMKEYSFTPIQRKVIKTAALSPLRKKFRR